MVHTKTAFNKSRWEGRGMHIAGIPPHVSTAESTWTQHSAGGTGPSPQLTCHLWLQHFPNTRAKPRIGRHAYLFVWRQEKRRLRQYMLISTARNRIRVGFLQILSTWAKTQHLLQCFPFHLKCDHSTKHQKVPRSKPRFVLSLIIL